MNILTAGTRIYNHGDQANESHFGTIIAVESDKWGTRYRIAPDANAERDPYTIEACMFHPIYKGHGGTRFVTEQAYLEWRAHLVARCRGGRAWARS